MKKKISSILGVSLALVLVLTLAAAFLPVNTHTAQADPGGNKWSEFSTPKKGSDGDYFMDTKFTALGPMEMAIDGSLFVAAYYDSDYHLFKSTDGREWTKTDYYDDAGEDAGDNPIVDIVCSSMDAEIVYVTDGTYIFWSEDADNFETLTQPTVSGTPITNIRCMDVGYLDEKPYIFIGTVGDNNSPDISDDDVWVCEQAIYGMPWDPLYIATDRITNYTAVDVFDVKVSNTFDSDQAVMALVGANGAKTLRTSKFGGAQWGVTEKDCELKYDDAGVPKPIIMSTTSDATIWLPDDFDSGDMEHFVGIDDATYGDVYWLIGTTVYDRDIDGSDSETRVTDLDGAGNVGDCSMIAGTYGGEMFYSTNNGDSWDDASKDATGDAEAYVRVTDDFLDSEEAFAVVSGTDGAVSITHDSGKLWNGVGMMATDMDCILDIAPTPDGAVFAVTEPTMTNDPATFNDGDSLWKYDGDNWERVFHSSLMSSDDYAPVITDVEVSPDWDSDEYVMFSDYNNNRYYYATDGGGRFKKANKQVVEPDNAGTDLVKQVFCWMVVDSSTIFAGADGGKIYRTTNNGTTWSGKDTDSGVITYYLTLDPNNPDNMLAGCSNGKVYLSEDGGGEWDSKGTVEDSTDIPMPAFDSEYADSGYFYAALVNDTSPSVYRYSSWDDIDGLSGTWPEDIGGDASVDVLAGYNIAVGSDGVLYVVNKADTAGSDVTGVARSVNAGTGKTSGDEGVYFENIDSGFPDDGTAFGLWITAGSNEVWTITGEGEYDEIWVYGDEITTPTLSSPSDGTTSGRTDEVTLRWNAPTNGDEYVVFFSRDPGFPDYAQAGGSYFGITQENLRITGLEDGTTYYWKVACWVGEPCLSLWSEEWSFTTALGEPEWHPFKPPTNVAPAPGATDVMLTPTFQWNPADWATGYEFVLAKDAAFTDAVISKTGANALTATVYLCETKLAYSTTYYWKVRAVGKTTESLWAQGVFSTEAAPPTPPAPPPPPPPEPEPVTPAYIWVIIGIGAALVIAVIILIVRTRRAV
jgi:photosystem II stability/assembly factor-like uncharacterized protein